MPRTPKITAITPEEPVDPSSEPETAEMAPARTPRMKVGTGTKGKGLQPKIVKNAIPHPYIKKY